MDTRIETILNAVINGETIEFDPRSKAEEYLKNCVNKSGVEGLPEPVSRLDALLYLLAGKMSEGGSGGAENVMDSFWDMYQQNGTRVGYAYAFAEVFTDEWFKPKYDMHPDNANSMFAYSKITNLKQLLENAGVTLDLSKARYTTQLFPFSNVTHVPTIDNRSSGVASSMFSDTSKLVYVEKFIVKETHTFPNCFARAYALVEIRFEGAIGNDINFQWSPLSVESMKSIISCLSTSVSGKTITFNDSCWAALEASGSAPDGGTWKEYVGSTLGWNT